MKTYLFIFFLTVIGFVHTGFASEPRKYSSVRSLMGNPFYRITCSDTNHEVHTHIFAEINEDIVREFKIVLAAPAESVKVIDFYGGDLAGFSANLSFTKLLIEGLVTSSYFNQKLSLDIRDGQRGMVGHFEYDDGDGFETSLDMICGATNYIRTK